MDTYIVRWILAEHRWVVLHAQSDTLVCRCESEDRATLVAHALNAYTAGSEPQGVAIQDGAPDDDAQGTERLIDEC